MKVKDIKLKGKTLDEQKEAILVGLGLDYTIVKEPSIVNYNGEILNTGYYSLINSKTKKVLNQVKIGYTISQNSEIVEQVLLASKHFKGLEIVKGGSLNGGRKVYLQLAIEGDAFIGNDVVKKYITVLDSNDGTASLSIGIGDFTMSCENQFVQFYKNSDYKHRHSSSITDKIANIHNQLEYALSRSMRMMDLYKDFQATKISEDVVDELVYDLLGNNKYSAVITPKALANMNMLYKNLDLEIEDKGLNLWGLHSGVTRWTTRDKQAPKRFNGRLESLISGTNYKFNQKSLAFAEKQLTLV